MAWDSPKWSDRQSFGEWARQEGKYEPPVEADDTDDDEG